MKFSKTSSIYQHSVDAVRAALGRSNSSSSRDKSYLRANKREMPMLMDCLEQATRFDSNLLGQPVNA